MNRVRETKVGRFLVAAAVGRLGLAAFLCVALPVAAGPIVPFDVTIDPGEVARIRFRFDDPRIAPEGNADILLVNGGSVSQGLLGTHVDLYANNHLIGSYSNTVDLSAFSIFTSPSTSYILFTNPTDLSSLFFDGAVGLLVYQPMFDAAVATAFVNYQFSTFGAFLGIGTNALGGDYPAPRILNVTVRRVPEPGSLVLLAAVLASLVLVRRRRSATPRSLMARACASAAAST